MLITPDVIIQQIIIEQYAYTVYAKFDVLIKIDSNDNSIPDYEYEGKRILVFLYNSDGDYSKTKELFKGYNSIYFIIFLHQNAKRQMAISISVSKPFVQKYIDYLMVDYPQVILSESDKELLTELGGCSLYNINQLMQKCFYSETTIKQIKSQNVFFMEFDVPVDEDENLIFTLSMKAIGIHKELTKLIIDEQKLFSYLKEQYLFINGNYIIPNVCLHLYYKDYLQLDALKLWSTFYSYIETLKDDTDQTIIEQVIWLLQKTIENKDHDRGDLESIIFKVEEILHRLYRFSNNDRLLEVETLCKEYFQEDKEQYIYLLVNEAILYEDIENFDVAKEKFEQAVELCDKCTDSEVYVFVMDEFSRLLEKTGGYQDALVKLYFVEQYYQKIQNIKKLQNVRNRIGLNLCFIGHIREATCYLERLYYGDFCGKICSDNVLSCEVANNLTICYMEMGNYNKALELQDELYRLYLVVENTPINYATDILQNKGSVYLYQHEYGDALLCFEQALKDEENPVSRELILENYLYAKAFSENDFRDSVQFFEVQIEEKTNYETCKMLAELYFGGEFFSECSMLCEKIMKEIIYEKNKILFLYLDILWLKSMIQLAKLTLWQKVKALMRLFKYQKFIKKNIGKNSPYYKEFQMCAIMLKIGYDKSRYVQVRNRVYGEEQRDEIK